MLKNIAQLAGIELPASDIGQIDLVRKLAALIRQQPRPEFIMQGKKGKYFINIGEVKIGLHRLLPLLSIELENPGLLEKLGPKINELIKAPNGLQNVTFGNIVKTCVVAVAEYNESLAKPNRLDDDQVKPLAIRLTFALYERGGLPQIPGGIAINP